MNIRTVFVFSVLAALFVISCGGASTPSQSSTSPSDNPLPDPGYFPPAEAMFMGDAITVNWPYPNANGVTTWSVPGPGGLFDESDGTICDIAMHYSIDTLRTIQPGAKRLVVLIGTFDIVEGVDCGGGQPPSIQEEMYYYSTLVKSARAAGLQVFVGTIPPLYGQWSIDDPQVDPLNQAIITMAQQNGAYVVNFHDAMESASDFVASGGDSLAIGLLPNSAGYGIMTSVYEAANQ